MTHDPQPPTQAAAGRSRRLSVHIERFPIAGRFTISRGAKTEAVVVVAEIRAGDAVGRGECVPYARYGETVEGVAAAIDAARPLIEAGIDRFALSAAMGAGAARNALDCALIDLEAKRAGRAAADLLGLGPLRPLVTAYTLSLGSPDEMATAAAAAAHRPVLKIKLGGEGDPERVRAVRAAAPSAWIIADANEAWSENTFAANMAACAEAGVMLIEQPLPAGDDALLGRVARPVPVCADESLHVAGQVAALAGRYDAVNIKLDKTGGLTEALLAAAEARRLGLDIMAGCMVGTSLAMAPALLLAQHATFVDLDGPLLLARDREPGLVYDGSTVSPPEPALWG
ncbi:L-alanine-DL-glutamate epimerase [Pseudoxanthobacter soli DSM 19599]|uniref:Dipeptide epimerase n=1 Tax=Pseudoxanthobacter soli DSM 19599 TaxID=1123029 RepID=A0A1M7ZQB0_9HYPH|nr:N-acetyl-D-Glu racemase DgcA [Pseudoxanthobacter soli]SHO67094.1 L-alanine-DL-glutamate epimerase [Pseudoxanthobacter soli DSM 19599]